ncbi:MAG: hypothetical protein A3F53_01370 [Candidatus Zambryskibacteria bacterium RIFCSPHIGHO2_12_FULL_48_10]|uniref:Transposase IS200-like domain-containing protein n=1 Tax=Candidatus Zambryskibacteria bacterium RIFCSPHIGHO2_01_FULL_46_25 TaxID=1802738 RepID=A0A1G2SZV4_9BACT|nr:MAG: hypothetical protein A2838_01040 [Candidatus Zambryskibacteria bacterium RIFCSPHIGHO2_01_FULL_46_25]OHB00950.1 MAG: hypothetical protein A3F53_01370 [Candidatus Zambryskibacteria bacterium RIFCSPHIGHO2_12_FULL_48_10]HCR52279.1 hypothetical protein [Candidatus Kaiserbacteria bacterium]
MRKVTFLDGEYYHIYNRGVDKRVIFNDDKDFERFLVSMNDFNSVEPIGSIYEHSFHKKSRLGNSVSKSEPKSTKKKIKPLVDFVAYCLNKNHFHFIVKQVSDRGVEKLMHRLGLGFTKYFNLRHERTGSLFQGPFQAVHIDSNEYLLYVGAYVNLNNLIHGYINSTEFRSSWGEYTGRGYGGFCKVDIILGQYKNSGEYKKIAEQTTREIKRKRDLDHLET